MRSALEGISILEIAQGFAAPGGVMYLADQGAEVIKIEPPTGDECRGYFLSAPLGGVAGGFLVANRNKRGIVVDLTNKKGRKVVHKLAQLSDVLVHNFRPGVEDRLGLDYETLHGLNPRLIYVSMTSFGRQGPFAQRRGYDMVTEALSGILGHRHMPDGTPVSPGVFAADCSTPMMLAYAVTLSLLVRKETGVGQRVDMSLYNQALMMQLFHLVRSADELNQDKVEEETYRSQALYSPYRCKDGRYLILVIVTDDQWARFCQVAGLEHLAIQPEFRTVLERAQRASELYPILEAVFNTKSSEEWDILLSTADVPSAPVLARHEVFTHPQPLMNNMIIEVDNPESGIVEMLGIPFTLSESPGKIRMPAPSFGQHTEEVLLELGYSKRQIQKLAASRAVVLSSKA